MAAGIFHTGMLSSLLLLLLPIGALFSCLISGVESFMVLHEHAVAASKTHSLMLSRHHLQHPQQQLSMTFYNDFDDMEEEEEEDLDEEDEEDDDEDYEEEMNDSAVAKFRSRMGTMFGDGAAPGDDASKKAKENSADAQGSSIDFDSLMSFVNSKNEQGSNNKDFANPSRTIESGVVLIANPAKFCTDFGNTSPSATLLSKFGLMLPPPADLGPDRRADLLPVLCLLEKHPLRGSHAVLLNRRTGYLLGDLEQQSPEDGRPIAPRLGAFMIQPLWFGGTSAGGTEESSSQSSALDMLHQCPAVNGAKQITPDGLYWGGDPAQAQDAMSDTTLERVFTGFDFKFFVQSTRWMPLQLEKEIRDGVWFVASVNKEVLFKPRDRMGTRRAKPLWTEIMELLGGEYLDIRNKLYGDKK